MGLKTSRAPRQEIGLDEGAGPDNGDKMENQSTLETAATGTPALRFNLGSFEGFNFRNQSAIECELSAEDVIGWDHDRLGEAEFWPSGDQAGVALIFRDQNRVTATELLALHRLLEELGGDILENFLKIRHMLSVSSKDLCGLTGVEVEDQNVHVFIGPNFWDLRREAAYELFELYYPEAYVVWEKSQCDGLVFDTDRFLDSPGWSVDEVGFANAVALIVAPN